jgi:hypothetical protein
MDVNWAGAHSKVRVVNLQNNALVSNAIAGAIRSPLRLNALSLANNRLVSVPAWIVEHCRCAARRAAATTRRLTDGWTAPWGVAARWSGCTWMATA